MTRAADGADSGSGGAAPRTFGAGTGGTQALTAPPALDIELATPDPIPEEGIEAAVRLMRTGTLFRYGETGIDGSAASQLEVEFATVLGRRFAVAVNSCGSSLFLALHCLGVGPGDTVLMNSWTLAPVPGAVAHVGARAVLVETTDDLTIDLADLERHAAEHPGSVLLLSHMRGHLADLDAVAEICRRQGLRLVEDCAHALGATWNGNAAGTYGDVACFSTQGYKHLNSGEGGILVTDDENVASRAILASGSYMLHGQHLSRPPIEHIEQFAGLEPNHSMRMTNLAATLLRPQLRELADKVSGWNARYALLSEGIGSLAGVRLPRRAGSEGFVGSSLQFFVDGISAERASEFCDIADRLGVHIKWFGAPTPIAFTSGYRSWAYEERAELPGTDAVLAGLFDIRVPLSLPLDRCADVVAIIGYALASSAAESRPRPETLDHATPGTAAEGATP